MIKLENVALSSMAIDRAKMPAIMKLLREREEALVKGSLEELRAIEKQLLDLGYTDNAELPGVEVTPEPPSPAALSAGEPR